MPPQQTNFTSETGRDTAKFRLDLANPLVNEASSEKEAAGPPVASTRSVLSVLRGYWRAFRRRRQAESLLSLSDRQLADIGLTPGDIDYLVARRAIERLRDGTTYLWP
jgi:uncharacterized protein YjiS (DUF1127 family)